MKKVYDLVNADLLLRRLFPSCHAVLLYAGLLSSLLRGVVLLTGRGLSGRAAVLTVCLCGLVGRLLCLVVLLLVCVGL